MKSLKSPFQSRADGSGVPHSKIRADGRTPCTVLKGGMGARPFTLMLPTVSSPMVSDRQALQGRAAPARLEAPRTPEQLSTLPHMSKDTREAAQTQVVLVDHRLQVLAPVVRRSLRETSRHRAWDLPASRQLARETQGRALRKVKVVLGPTLATLRPRRQAFVCLRVSALRGRGHRTVAKLSRNMGRRTLQTR